MELVAHLRPTGGLHQVKRHRHMTPKERVLAAIQKDDDSGCSSTIWRSTAVDQLVRIRRVTVAALREHEGEAV